MFVLLLFFFFFKQKTAYEIGLGIPAEPLFRSTLFPYTPTAISIFVCLSMVQLMAVFKIGRASCRERVYVSLYAVALEKKIVVHTLALSAALLESFDANRNELTDNCRDEVDMFD